MPYRYFATFISGSKKIVGEILRKQYPYITVEEFYENLVVFHTTKPINDPNIPFLNNLCYLCNKFGSENMQEFSKLVDWATEKETFWQFVSNYIKFSKYKKYRIYFFENVTTVSEQEELTILKDFLSKTLNLSYSAHESEFEIWFIKRREGVSFIGIRLTKKHDYQETNEKGQLRDELAYILSAYASPTKNDVFLDPFCGHGSIPLTLATQFRVKKIFASDIDTTMIAEKIKESGRKYQNLQVSKQDGFTLDKTPDESIDKIVTDPPWGVALELENPVLQYGTLMKNINRVLKRKGVAVVLSTQIEAIKLGIKGTKLSITDEIEIYVSGQKAFVTQLEKR